MNTFDLPTISVGAIAVVPIIIAIVQALKMTGYVQDKYAPFISIAVGILIGFLSDHDTNNLSNTILNGVMYGLSASGLYSGVQESTKSIRANRVNYQSKAHRKEE